MYDDDILLSLHYVAYILPGSEYVRVSFSEWHNK